MKCKIIEAKTYYDLEDKINKFIKNLDNCTVSITSNEIMARYSDYKTYTACITWK